MAEKMTSDKLLDQVLRAKQQQRRKLARLPFEQKIELVLRMQQDSKALRDAKRPPR